MTPPRPPRADTCGSRGLGQGGHLEFGESFEQCARREVKEECGVDLDWVCYGTTLNVHSQGDK